MFVHSKSNMSPHYNLLSYPKQTKKHSKMSVHSKSNMFPHYTHRKFQKKLQVPLPKSKKPNKSTHVSSARKFIKIVMKQRYLCYAAKHGNWLSKAVASTPLPSKVFLISCKSAGEIHFLYRILNFSKNMGRF